MLHGQTLYSSLLPSPPFFSLFSPQFSAEILLGRYRACNFLMGPHEGTMEGDEASSPENWSPKGGRDEGIPEYERQRLSRLKENRARLEALGIPQLASSLIGSLSEHLRPGEEGRGKKKAKARKGVGRSKADGEDDEEYRPSDEDNEEEQEGESSSSSEGVEEEEDKRPPPSGSHRKGKKRKSLNAKKARKHREVEGTMKKSDDFIDDDAALKQAIALSLGEAMEEPAPACSRFSQNSGTNVADSGHHGKKDSTSLQETAGKRKNKKLSKSRVQLSEDEVVAYFFSFDEVGKGHITVRDLQRMAIAHDFTWTDGEIANMIHCFDSNGDGKNSSCTIKAG